MFAVKAGGGVSSTTEYCFTLRPMSFRVGDCRVTPSAGYALDTAFNVVCSGFVNKQATDAHLQYSLLLTNTEITGT